MWQDRGEEYLVPGEVLYTVRWTVAHYKQDMVLHPRFGEFLGKTTLHIVKVLGAKLEID